MNLAVEALVIDPSVDGRMRLKQVATSTCKAVRLASTLQEGIARLEGDSDFHLVCLSSRYDDSHAGEFLTRAKSTKGGQDSAYVMVMSADSQRDEQRLAKNLLNGFDASLLEPCSVNDFEHTAQLALELKGKRKREREAAAIKIFAESALKYLDEICTAKLLKRPTNIATAKLQEISAALQRLSQDQMVSYYDHLIAKAEVAAPIKVYTGASERLRRRVVMKR